MIWSKGVCSICSAGESGGNVDVRKLEAYEDPDGHMCRVCYDLGLSGHYSQNDRPSSRVDISRAVRYLIEQIKVPT